MQDVKKGLCEMATLSPPRLSFDVMNGEEQAYQDEPALKDLVRKFEAMVRDGDQAFFDMNELEGLIEHYLQVKETRKAEMALRHARQLYPGHLGLKLRQAQIWANSGKPVKAVPLLKDLLNIEPHSEEILMTLGAIYSQITEHKQAIDCFKRALIFADSDTRREIRIDIALEFENLGAWKDAIRNLEEALDEDPGNETAVYELAFCFERTGQFKRAAAFYEKFLDEQPYSFAAWYSMGNALQQCGKFPQAIDAYDFAIAIESSFGPAYHQKAEALVAMERYNDALHTYEETLSFEEVSPRTKCYMGECLERLGNLEQASEYYRASLKLDPAFADAFIGLGVLADLQGRLGEACSHFEQALSIEPEHADYHLLLAGSLKKKGEHERAEKVYTQGLILDIRNEEIWLERIDNLQVSDRHENALEVIDDSETALGQNGSIGYRKFISLYALGRQVAAFEFLEHLLVHHFDEAQNLIDLFPALANDARFVKRLERFKP